MKSISRVKGKRQPKPRYVPWGLSKPIQNIKKVWGLGAEAEHCIDLTIIGDNPLLMDMDAPIGMPAGSMLREEYVHGKTIYFAAKQRVVPRQG